MKKCSTWYTSALITASIAVGLQAHAQGAPGTFADTNHPAGAPDPEKAAKVWQVDPISGQVSIRIPFETTPQGVRGPKIPFALIYNSGSTVTLQANGVFYTPIDGSLSVFQWSPTPVGFIGGLVAPTGPWITTGPFIYSEWSNLPDQGFTDSNGSYHVTGYGCYIYGPYVYTDENGSAHDMGIEQFSSNYSSGLIGPCSSAQSDSATYGSTSWTSDGSAMLTTNGSVIGPDGTSTSGRTITDANLNSATLTTSAGVTTATDTIGRTLFKTNIPIGKAGQIAPGSYYLTTYGETGNAENYSITFSNVALGSFTLPHPTSLEITNSGYCSTGTCPNKTVNPPGQGSMFPVVTSISRPDLTSYTFTYDQTYGTIHEIDFPTGGHVRFAWKVRDKDWNPYGSFTVISDVVVTDAFVSSGSAEDDWRYDLASLTTSTVPKGSVYPPDGTRTDYTGTCFSYTRVPLYQYSGRPGCKVSLTSSYDVNGTLVKSVQETFNSWGLPIQVATTLYDGPSPLQQQIMNVYDSWGNVIERDESDFYSCAGSPCPIPSSQPSWRRSTFTSYAYTSNTSLANAHIVNKPSKVLITDGVGSNGSGASPTGTPYSLVNYGYDSKGNLQYDDKCSSISGAGTSAACSSAWRTAYYYDSTGQITCKVDGLGLGTNQVGSCPAAGLATTSYSWGGQGNGFLLNVQYSNGASDSYTYYTSTGQVNTHAGWNNSQVTTYDYTDPLHRVKTITSPITVDGTTGSNGQGTTTFNYTDVAEGFTVEERHSVDGIGTTTSTTKSFDGLGRETRSTTASPQCGSGIKVDTMFDSMSRVYSVTNPYCGTTNGTTYFQYDALGRKTQTTFPDGATSTLSYGANATEITDPFNGATNVQHIQQVDGLGHLTNVCEVSSLPLGPDANPNSCGLNKSGSGYLTSYTYDPLGNLLTVNQHGVSRQFVYDQMSRLTQSTNPESGSSPALYTYSTPSSACAPDPAVPCTRTDVRGVKTSYTYDSMSRLTGKTYATVSGNTTGAISDLSSCYQYDTALSGVTDAYPKGQLTAEWQQAGSCPTSSVSTVPASAIGVRIRSNHDALGHVGRDQQCLTASTCSTTGNFVYSYNLLGGPVQANNGILATTVSATQTATTNSTPMNVPSVTWKTTYDSMGHISQASVQDQPATSVWPIGSVGAAFSFAPTLLQATNYDAFGHMTAAQLGIPNGSSTPAVSISRQYDVRARMQSEQDQGTVVTSVASGSAGSITIGGSEKSVVQNGAAATAAIGISGSEQTYTFDPCVPHGSCPQTIPDGGGYSIYVNGVSAGGFGWGSGATSSNLATLLASSINGNSNSPVTASASGSSVTLTSKVTGPAGNYSISVTRSWSSSYFSSPSFSVSAPSSMAGGTSGSTVYDSGTVSATINGHTTTVSWSNGSTSSSVASTLASAISTMDSSFLTASVSGSVVSLISVGTGSTTNWPVQVAVTYDTAHFSSASFTASPSGMTGGSTGGSNPGTIYSYQVPSSGGYAPNGNILQHIDSVMGTWNFNYDAVDRLVTGNQTSSTSLSTQYAGKFGCWRYDTRGNRTMEAFSSANCNSNPTPQVLNTYYANNQISSSTLSSTTLTAGSFIYDASGHTLYDGLNEYWYDAEGQLCAVQSKRYGNGPVIQYAYDAEGARIAKGTTTSSPAPYSVISTGLASSPTCAPPLGSNFTKSARYLVDLGGDQVTEVDGSGNWQHSNVWAGGRLIATYDRKGIHFDLTDPLGTKRVQANAQGQVDEWCTGLPFGNDLNNPVSANCTFAIPQTNPLQTYDDATEHHYTVKEHDTESGNDYFEARYYSGAMGRFMSPDWSNTPQPLPYGDLKNPQSLNLYGYADNNPLTKYDEDGHCSVDGETHGGVWCFFHTLGFTETAKERLADQIDEARKYIAANRLDAIKVNGHWQPSSSSTDSDVASWWKDYNDTYRDALNQGISPGAALAAMAGRIGGGGGIIRLTNAQVNDLAKWSGMEPVKDAPFDSHGQKVFKIGNRYFSPDVDGHSGGVWKEFDRQGNRVGTLDVYLEKIGK